MDFRISFPRRSNRSSFFCIALENSESREFPVVSSSGRCFSIPRTVSRTSVRPTAAISGRLSRKPESSSIPASANVPAMDGSFPAMPLLRESTICNPVCVSSGRYPARKSSASASLSPRAEASPSRPLVFRISVRSEIYSVAF